MPEAAPSAAPSDARPSRETLQAWIATISEGLLQRETAARLALLGALAGEHVLLIGPPGTAKSALARRLHRAFSDARYFERLLTRFSTPEELFGPLSLKALEHDRYERLIEGFLPTAGIAFLDEVFKANSAILNALLTLLNEREFDNGTQRLQTPLVAVVAASNEVPTDEALVAFHDRFLLRIPIAPVGDDAFEDLLTLRGDSRGPAPDAAVPDPSPATGLAPVSAAQRKALRTAATQVELTADFIDACRRLRTWLQGRGAPLSDRRWRQFVGLVRLAAASEGRATADALDLWLVTYVANHQPADVDALAQWFEREVLTLPAAQAPWLERAVEAFEKQLQIEQSAPPEDAGPDDAAGKLALARAIGLTSSGPDDAGSMAPRIVSHRVEAQLKAQAQRSFSRPHRDARVAQVAEIQEQVQQSLDATRGAGDALAERLAPRLWVGPTLRRRIDQAFEAALGNLDGLAARLQAIRLGFDALPLREDPPFDPQGLEGARLQAP